MSTERPASIYWLLAANAVPLLGVLFFRWELIDVLFLYWAESVIIGVSALFKMLLARDDWKGWLILLSIFMRLLGGAFFLVHFGGFIAGIGAALYFIAREIFQTPVEPWSLIAVTWPALLGMVISHGYSFIVNFWIKGERDIEAGNDPIVQAYGRVLVLHLSLAFGLGPVIFFGQPIYLLAVFIILKTGVDLRAHLKERRKFAPAQ